MNAQVYTMSQLIVNCIEKKKILRVNVFDVHELTPLADVFIIVIASNVRQTQALADEVEELLKEKGCTLQKEGYHTATWILLDCGPIIVHILEEEDADFYGLERLWKDAPQIEF